MVFVAAVLFWSFTAAGPAFSQFLSPPADLISVYSHPAGYQVRYKVVPPGICEQRDDIKSISGYVDVSADEHMFFWFFEARNADPTTAPLTAWINGGPGTSSMVGLFQEMGPCAIETDGNVVNNPYSWTNASNLLFIDQPLQTGFSYSTTIPGYISPQDGSVIIAQEGVCPSDEATNGTCGTYSNPNDLNEIPVSTSAAASAFYATLQGFIGVFPQYAREEFHFATESYGGHYGPVFAEYIEAQNARQRAGTTRISLATVTIINGWMNPLIQYAAYYNFTVYPGNTYDYTPYNDSAASALYSAVYGSGGCVEQLQNCVASKTDSVCAAADTFCLDHVENFYDAATGRDEDDVREPEPDPYPSESYVRYLNNATVQAAIGAFVNYTEQSVAVAAAFNTTGDDGRLDGTTTDVLALVEQGVAVTMVYGDADYNSRDSSSRPQPMNTNKLTNPTQGNWLGGEAVYNSIRVPGRPTPGYVNISTADLVVHGQAKQSGAFAFARIYDSGHEVPYYQPLTALAIFERAISRYDVATGEDRVGRGYVTVGPVESTYREGNATVVFALREGGGEISSDATTYDDTVEGESAPARLLTELDDELTHIDLNATARKAQPHGDAEGLSHPALELKEEETVHITRRRRRRGVDAGWYGKAVEAVKLKVWRA